MNTVTTQHAAALLADLLTILFSCWWLGHSLLLGHARYAGRFLHWARQQIGPLALALVLASYLCASYARTGLFADSTLLGLGIGVMNVYLFRYDPDDDARWKIRYRRLAALRRHPHLKHVT